MANNCLVTKLKGVAQNSDLPYLNGFEVKFKSGYPEQKDRAIRIDLPQNSTFKIISTQPVDVYYQEGLIKSGVTNDEVTAIGTATYILFPNENGKCVIISKHEISSIGYNLNHPILGTQSNGSYRIDVSQLETMENILSISALQGIPTGVFKPGKHQTDFTFGYGSNTELVLDLGVLKDTTILTTICGKSLGCVTGSINDLNKNLNISSIILYGNPVGGDIKTLCDDLYSNGKTSGTINFDCTGANITYNGELFTTTKCNELTNGKSSTILEAAFNSSGWSVITA